MPSTPVPAPGDTAYPRAGRAVFAAAALLICAAVAVHYSGREAPGLAVLWACTGAGFLLVRCCPPRTPEADMRRRLMRALAGHTLTAEVVALAVCLAAFAGSDVLFDRLLDLVGAATVGGAPIAYYAAKTIFLLLLPALLVGRTGIMRDWHGPDVAGFGLRVSERWRWGGLPVAFLVPVLFAVPWTPAIAMPGRLPSDQTVFLVLAAAFLFGVFIEVYFFAVLLQTRLEVLFGRWPAVLAMGTIYPLFSLVGIAFAPEEAIGRGAEALAALGAGALLGAYVWSRYRNLWVTLLQQGITVTVASLPVVSENLTSLSG